MEFSYKDKKKKKKREKKVTIIVSFNYKICEIKRKRKRMMERFSGSARRTERRDKLMIVTRYRDIGV